MFCADYKSTNIIIAERSLTLDGVDDQSNNIKLNLHINEVNIAKIYMQSLGKDVHWTVLYTVYMFCDDTKFIIVAITENYYAKEPPY
jgi:hypothetical protein